MDINFCKRNNNNLGKEIRVYDNEFNAQFLSSLKF